MCHEHLEVPTAARAAQGSVKGKSGIRVILATTADPEVKGHRAQIRTAEAQGEWILSLKEPER